MRKFLAAGLAALTLGGAMAAAAVPAQAEPHGGGHFGGGHYGGGHAGFAGGHGGYGGYRGGYGRGGWGHGGYYRGGGYGWGVPLAAGIAGLAVGSALAAPYDDGYYGYPGYAYDYGPGVCEAGHWSWDPYLGRNVWVRSPVPC